MLRTSTAFVAVELLAACVWVGSLVCLAVVANAARRVLDPPVQVAFFRAIGRRYAMLGTGALAVTIGCGLVLSWPPSAWTPATAVAVALSGSLLIVTFAAMAQARSMTARRTRAARDREDTTAAEAVRRGQAVAGGLRSVMALLTLAVVILAAYVVTH